MNMQHTKPIQQCWTTEGGWNPTIMWWNDKTIAGWKERQCHDHIIGLHILSVLTKPKRTTVYSTDINTLTNTKYTLSEKHHSHLNEHVTGHTTGMLLILAQVWLVETHDDHTIWQCSFAVISPSYPTTQRHAKL